MLAPGDPVTKPFGTRRSPEDAETRASATAAGDWDGRGRSAGALGWALRMSAAFGLLAVFAVHHLARLSQPDQAGAGPPIQTAMAGRPSPADPETTGAITPAGAARAIRLDPCLLPALDRPRP